MTKKYWFKAKKYGWGWYPGTWQGWLIVAAYVVVVVGGTFIWEENDPAGNYLVDFLFVVFGMTALMILVCFKKGEEPHWRWEE